MKRECNIIRDILPLYAENMVSAETVDFVEEHLKVCSHCQQELESVKVPKLSYPTEEAVPLVKLRGKMRAKKLWIIGFTAFFVMALLVSAFAFLSAPEFFPYEENLFTITEHPDNSITITFDQKVTNYSCRKYFDNGEENNSSGKGACSYNIEAWTSLWDRWFSHRGVQATTLRPEEDIPFTVYYLSNNNEEDVCIYGNPPMGYDGSITLPRLVLGYYLILQFLGFGFLLLVRFAVRQKKGFKLWVERIMLYPISYVLGHLGVLGFHTISYSAVRDFTLILFLSLLIYWGLLLVYHVYRFRKEQKKI